MPSLPTCISITGASSSRRPPERHKIPPVTATETLLRRDRLVVAACLLVICGLSWWYVFVGAGTGMSIVAMTTWQFPPPVYATTASAWPLSYWCLMVAMWWVMMIAMMLPSASPVVLLYTRVQRHHTRLAGEQNAVVPTLSFVLGYLLSWLAFSLLATVLQWALEQLGLVHGMMMWSSNRGLSALFLVAAGLYQLSPQKAACLDHCQSPVAFLSRHWRSGRLGALRMGLLHGAYCVGCCWSLMLLLFVGGIMNLVWIAGLAIFVLVEKLLSGGDRLARYAGGLLVMAGIWLLL